MTRYRVHAWVPMLVQTVVEAENEMEAEEKAQRKIASGDHELLDADNDDIAVSDIKELT